MVDTEIWNSYRRFKESGSRFQVKMDLWKRLYLTLVPHFPRCNVMVFGSTCTEFALSDADMDVVLILDEKGRYPGSVRGVLSQTEKIDTLVKCRSIINDRNNNSNKVDFKVLNLIEAYVPILVLDDTKTSEKVKIELSVSDGIYVEDGTRNTHLLSCYGAMDERVKPLVIVIKKWAEFHVLIGTLNKRLSSYGLVLMIIFYLQQRQVLPCLQEEYERSFRRDRPVTDTCEYVFHRDQKSIQDNFKSANTESMFSLLLGFFKFYSEFNYRRNVISIRTGKVLDYDLCLNYASSREQDERQWERSEALIEDPIFRYNVARATSDRDTWLRILNTFRISYDRLLSGKKLKDIYF